MIFIGTMNNRYGDFNTELENAAILSALVAQHGDVAARHLFDLLNPRFTDNAPTTIPREDWSRPVRDVLGIEKPCLRSCNADAECFRHASNHRLSAIAMSWAGRNWLRAVRSWSMARSSAGISPSYVYSVGIARRRNRRRRQHAIWLPDGDVRAQQHDQLGQHVGRERYC